jgi:hypothetical protein
MGGNKDPGVKSGSFRDPKPLPPDSPAGHQAELAKPRAFLDRLRVHHVDLSERFLLTSDGDIFSVDLMIAAVMNRSYSLVDGFIDAFDSWNLVVAAPVLRIQIDSLVRLAYMASAPSSEEVAAYLIRGGEFRKLRDKGGKKLTDRRLIELADTAHPWVKGVYEATSGWVHLSPTHMYATWQVHDSEPAENEEETYKTLLGAIPTRPEQIPVSALRELLGGMTKATAEIFAYVEVWESRKGLPTGETRDIRAKG